MPLSSFHPVVSEWFRMRFGAPTDVQELAWPAIRSGSDTLIAAPTGSGKTLAAFLTCIDSLFTQALDRELRDHTQVLYVSPLKALSNDVQKNLQQPLNEIGQAALTQGLLLQELRVLVRTGDTSMAERQRMLRRPPHILITTPESLFILLTAEKSRALLRTVRTVIVDEIHAVAATKRGAHVALSLERLEALTDTKPVRIGLSATQRPIETVAQFLVGDRPRPQIVDVGHRRTMDLAVEVPKDELSAVATNAIWGDIYDRIADLVRAHRSTLVFVNTRRLAERVAHHLEERLQDLGVDAVAAHHGSLARQIRLSAEERLKSGRTRVVVATASLELGIDVGTVDLVCQIGSPRAIATCLQRVGRAGHWVKAIPKGRLFAATRDELIECAALIRAIRSGLLDRIAVPPAPLDILAQQLVAAAATQAWSEDDLFALIRRAYPYRELDRAKFDEVLHMLAEGIATSRGRGQAYLHHDRINRRVRGRRGARLAAITSGGAIPDNANYVVVAEPEGTVVGSVDEDFAVESLAGDIMLLGNTSWRIKGIEMGKVRVEDAQGAPPNIPFWRGEAPARTAELSAEVAWVRREIDRLVDPQSGESALRWLKEECGLPERGAQQAVEYVLAGKAVLGTVPTQETVVAERFFDESGGMQLVIHAPFGGRVNKAWGLALRKRFCVTFDFELQAAATDEGLVISLGEKHSFPLETVFSFLQATTVRDVLAQAVLVAPMFTTRWRWNVTRALALLRFAKGKKVPPQIQRMKAEDLLAAVFPDAIACQENLRGDGIGGVERRIPDHPLVEETLRDCLTEAMDVEGLITLLRRLEEGTIHAVAVETPMPSPFSHEILNANPYAYLDDAPLEERRARAVDMRRTLPPELAGQAGALDQAAIAEVAQESWPVVRNVDELHDALLTLVWVPQGEAPNWEVFLPELVAAHRACVLNVPRDESVGDGHPDQITRRISGTPGHLTGWVATEQVPLALALFPSVSLEDLIHMPTGMLSAPVDREEAVETMALGWMESTGPTTVAELAGRLGYPEGDIHQALLRLEAKGQILRGQFRPLSTLAVRDSPLSTQSSALSSRASALEPQHSALAGAHATEWCHRRLLARIHRLTIGSLRREIEPVSAAEFMGFLFRWQHVAPGSRLHGERGLLEIITQLAGFEAAASAWESGLLRARLSKYDPELLDRLCFGGSVVWGRLSPYEPVNREVSSGRGRRVVPTSLAPISLFPREDADWLLAQGHQSARTGSTVSSTPQIPLSVIAQNLRQVLSNRGASFFSELLQTTGHLPSEIEQALWELVAAGLVTADGFDSLRALMDPKRRRGEGRLRTQRPRHSAGRWSLLRRPEPSLVDTQSSVASLSAPGTQHSALRTQQPVLSPQPSANPIESLARQLLARYGVVFRDLLGRESDAIAWRDLLVQYRRMELRGEIRGGRFVGGFTGDQFALPEAVETLRALRKGGGPDPKASQDLRLSACDPLNLAGVILPGPRIPALPTNFVLFRNGIPVASSVENRHHHTGKVLTKAMVWPG
ncbi:MAG: DEAD/DEAH box helicase [Nitrospiraceae bacterium]